jgi:5-methyltetrahydrofolate--homocysteine methyltransferase
MDIKARIKQGPFLLDGGMGSQLIARKISVSKCNDYLNIETPDQIEQIHRDYLDAGCDAVITNTFGANEVMLARHGVAGRAAEINKAGAQIARRAAGRDKVVLGDIGPCGDFLLPVGPLEPQTLKRAFEEQVAALCVGGVDGLIIETMTALEELTLAVEAAIENSDGRPVWASMAFDKTAQGFRTMMGVDVDTAVSALISLGIDAVGFNCGTVTLAEYIQLGEQFMEAVHKTGTETPVYAEANAGTPELIDGQAVYKVTPQVFAETVAALYNQGIRILGGCCGTGPAHIVAVAERLKTVRNPG